VIIRNKGNKLVRVEEQKLRKLSPETWLQYPVRAVPRAPSDIPHLVAQISCRASFPLDRDPQTDPPSADLRVSKTSRDAVASVDQWD